MYSVLAELKFREAVTYFVNGDSSASVDGSLEMVDRWK